jgi:hypothetical protein
MTSWKITVAVIQRLPRLCQCPGFSDCFAQLLLPFRSSERTLSAVFHVSKNKAPLLQLTVEYSDEAAAWRMPISPSFFFLAIVCGLFNSPCGGLTPL